jgi:hypothetical protein
MFRELMVVLMQASHSHPYHIAHTQRDFQACLPSAIQSVHVMWTVPPASIQDGPYGIGPCCVAVCQGVHWI